MYVSLVVKTVDVLTRKDTFMTQLNDQQGTRSSPTQPESSQGHGSNIVITYETKPGLAGLSIKNFALNLITLSIYRFWAKTDVRKHIWSCVHINGEPLEYTGRGLELFLGALVVLLIFLPIVFLIQWLQMAGHIEFLIAVQGAFTLLFFMLIGMAIYRARRYRLSRTVWRGVRGALVGSSLKYSLLYFGSVLLSAITLGWSNPAMNLQLQEQITKDMRFGETPFGFKGKAGPLYGSYAIAWFVSLGIIVILAIIGGFAIVGRSQNIVAQVEGAGDNPKLVITMILGVYGALFLLALVFAIIWSFYTAYEMAKFASYTYFDNATFRFNATGPSLIMLWVVNIFIVIISLGIAIPFTVQRTIRYFIDRLDVDGWVNIGQIQQSQARIDPRGEGLLDAFDIDGI